MKLSNFDEDEPILNLTPMIDVVFTLLVFFMLATTFAERERVLDVELPYTKSVSATDAIPKELVINVSVDGAVSIDGRSVRGDELHQALADAARLAPGIQVTVRGDRRGNYDGIVQVLDECMQAGLDNLSLSTLDGG